MTSRDVSGRMGALVAVHELVQAADDRVCGDVRVTDLRDVVDRVMAAIDITRVTLPDMRFVAGTFWADIQEGEGAQAIGMLLKLRAMADHPDVCAAVFQRLADKLEQGLFSDTPLDPSEV